MVQQYFDCVARPQGLKGLAAKGPLYDRPSLDPAGNKTGARQRTERVSDRSLCAPLRKQLKPHPSSSTMVAPEPPKRGSASRNEAQ